MNELEHSAQDHQWIDLNQIDLPSDALPCAGEKIKALAQDMEIRGQLQDTTVTDEGGRFCVVAGVGRFLAARMLRWKKVRCNVRPELSEFERARIAYSDNERQHDRDPFYQAVQLQKMIKAKGWNQNQLRNHIGNEEQDINTYLGLIEIG